MTSTTRILTRVGLAVLALGVGFVIGVVTTFTHRQLPPGGLIVGVLVVAAYIAGLRLAFRGRLAAASGAVGVLLALAVLSLPTSGGSVLIVDDAPGLVWAVAPILVAALVVAWPEPRSRPDVPRRAE